jgi:hypothetical protein
VFTFPVSRFIACHLSPFTFHGLYGLALVLILTTGCATSLKREGRCLASLTPEFLQAQEELASLEGSWHRAMARRDAEFNRAQPLFTSSSEPLSEAAPLDPTQRAWNTRQTTAGQDSREAYRRLIEAKSRHQPLLVWYGKVYERVRTRMDEEEILSDVRLVLVAGPGVIFYPLIHWNIHSVFWDGTDPDAESDPVTRYCTDRLAQVAIPGGTSSTLQ